MRKHIAYLIAGIIAGLILGMIISAGGEEQEEESDNIKLLRLYLNPTTLDSLILSTMNDLVITQYKIIEKTLPKATHPADRDNITNYWTMQMQLYIYIQNYRLLLQNEQIIRLLIEIRDKK